MGIGEEEGGRKRKERAWYLLQAKPRLLIGWRDSAGFLALPVWIIKDIVTTKHLLSVIEKTAKKSHG